MIVCPDRCIQQCFEAGRHNLPAPEAEALSLDVQHADVEATHKARVVASFSDRSVYVWTVPATSNEKAELIFSVPMDDNVLPKTVKFDSASRDIYVFSATGGYM